MSMILQNATTTDESIRSRARRALRDVGIISPDFSRPGILEVDTRRLQNVTERDIIRARGCGPKTLPVCMQAVEQLRDILLWDR